MENIKWEIRCRISKIDTKYNAGKKNNTKTNNDLQNTTQN